MAKYVVWLCVIYRWKTVLNPLEVWGCWFEYRIETSATVPSNFVTKNYFWPDEFEHTCALYVRCGTHGKNEKCGQNYGRQPWRYHYGDRNHGRIILRWVQNRKRFWMDSIGSGSTSVVISCECSNKPTVYVIGESFVDQLSPYYLSKKGSNSLVLVI
jgi:hypothetical protein